MERGEREGKSLLDAIRDGNQEGMQAFDTELERMARAGTISVASALGYSTNHGNLRLQLSDMIEESERQAVSRPEHASAMRDQVQ